MSRLEENRGLNTWAGKPQHSLSLTLSCHTFMLNIEDCFPFILSPFPHLRVCVCECVKAVRACECVTAVSPTRFRHVSCWWRAAVLSVNTRTKNAPPCCFTHIFQLGWERAHVSTAPFPGRDVADGGRKRRRGQVVPPEQRERRREGDGRLDPLVSQEQLTPGGREDPAVSREQGVKGHA